MKNFSVLSPLCTLERFGAMRELKVEIGSSSVISMARDLLPLDDKNWYVPVWKL